MNQDDEVLTISMDEDRQVVHDVIPWRSIKDETTRADSPDRSSPPLFEVELTASDEDDDASVLELVIPMTSRYQRVPTSSPKKHKPKVLKRYIYSMMCCVRK